MPTTTRRPTVAPIIVERRPDDVSDYSDSTPTSSTSPSAKSVRFNLVEQASRQLTYLEQCSLYYFEHHALRCQACRHPYSPYGKHGSLCQRGHDLAQDVALHVVSRGHELYSRQDMLRNKLVRVELPHNYDQVRALLHSIDRHARRHPKPIVSYDHDYPTTSPRAVPVSLSPVTEQPRRRATVVVQPTTTRTRPSDSSQSAAPPSKTTKYRITRANAEPEIPAAPRSHEKRGSIYVQDISLQRKTDYVVEVREPPRKERQPRRRRDSAVYL